MSVGADARGQVRTTENCRYCWMCRHVCPVGHVTSSEVHTPHAWALTIESVRRGQIAWTPDSVDVLYACADCGLCRTHCVTDQPLPDAIVSARAEVVGAGVAPAAVQQIAERLQRYANVFATQTPKRNASRGRTALFVGDAAGVLAPRSVDAALALLAAAGVRDVVAIGHGRSSGLVASSLGLIDLARSLAHEVVDEIVTSGAEELLVLCPADRWTFAHVYRSRLGVPWPAGLHAVEVTAVLARAASEGRLSLQRATDQRPYAYHDACHAPRVRDGSDAPRALLAAVLGGEQARQLFWREERAHPCGAIGGLEYTHPDISRRLAESRLQDARRSGARRIVTEDGLCASHLSRHAGADVEVVDLYELLAAHLRPQ